MKRIFYTITFIVSLYSKVAIAQDLDDLSVFVKPQKFYQKFFPNLKIKKAIIDTASIKSYPNYLTIGTHLIHPTIAMDLLSKSSVNGADNATSNFRTNIGNIVAFTVSYRFITAGFALVASSNSKTKDSYASTKFRTATIKYNAAAYYLQFKYIRTRGYTDVNSFNSNDSLKNYLRRDDLLTKEYQFEGMYNFNWKKYSYYAPIDYTYRQLKSRWGFLLKAGVYYNEFKTDTNLLSITQRPYFDEFTNVGKISSTSFKVAPGIGGNLVFLRRFYLSAAVFTPYNLTVYNYFTTNNEKIHKGTSIARVLDGNVSIGYQSERFYAGVRYQADTKSIIMNSVNVNTVFSYLGFDIGYRFVAPNFVKKTYKKTMPPGM